MIFTDIFGKDTSNRKDEIRCDAIKLEKVSRWFLWHQQCSPIRIAYAYQNKKYKVKKSDAHDGGR